jgi:hypothetical protein
MRFATLTYKTFFFNALISLASSAFAALSGGSQCPGARVVATRAYHSHNGTIGKIGITVKSDEPLGVGISYVAVRLECQSHFKNTISTYVSLSGTEPSATVILPGGDQKEFLVDIPYQAVPETCRPSIVACFFPFTE